MSPLGPELRNVSGAFVSIVKRSITGVGSVVPPAVARTANVCSPLVRPSNDTGDEHPPNAAPSSEHSNAPPGGSASNAKLAVWRGPVSTDVPPRASVCPTYDVRREIEVSGTGRATPGPE